MKTKRTLAVLAAAAALMACSPKYDWRDFRSSDAPFSVLFPGKPATHSRVINLDGQQVNMSMAAAEVEGTMFAVGSVELPDADKAAQAVQAMKAQMVRNIGATVNKESTKDGAFLVDASGVQNGTPDAHACALPIPGKTGLPGGGGGPVEGNQ
ncbi:hypothetical protein ACHMW6_03260 [Pseudoduganella sp. UC29_106]